MPAELMTQEDQNKDGFVSWDEFSGPKGDKLAVVVNEEGKVDGSGQGE